MDEELHPYFQREPRGAAQSRMTQKQITEMYATVAAAAVGTPRFWPLSATPLREEGLGELMALAGLTRRESQSTNPEPES